MTEMTVSVLQNQSIVKSTTNSKTAPLIKHVVGITVGPPRMIRQVVLLVKHLDVDAKSLFMNMETFGDTDVRLQSRIGMKTLFGTHGTITFFLL